MDYNVHLTFEGDPALAAQWAGFAKKKAREFGQFCGRLGQSHGVKWYDITPDVRLKVRYVNGIQFAHLVVGGVLHGIVFKTSWSGNFAGWGEPFTEANLPMGTAAGAFPERILAFSTKRTPTPGASLKVLRSPYYLSRIAGDPASDVLCTQAVTYSGGDGEIISVGHYAVGTGFRTTYPAHAESVGSARSADFFIGGVRYSCPKSRCLGVTKYQGHYFVACANSTSGGATVFMYQVTDLTTPFVWPVIGSYVIGANTFDTTSKNFLFFFSRGGNKGATAFKQYSPTGSAGGTNYAGVVYVDISYDANAAAYVAIFTVRNHITSGLKYNDTILQDTRRNKTAASATSATLSLVQGNKIWVANDGMSGTSSRGIGGAAEAVAWIKYIHPDNVVTLDTSTPCQYDATITTNTYNVQRGVLTGTAAVDLWDVKTVTSDLRWDEIYQVQRNTFGEELLAVEYVRLPNADASLPPVDTAVGLFVKPSVASYTTTETRTTQRNGYGQNYQASYYASIGQDINYFAIYGNNYGYDTTLTRKIAVDTAVADSYTYELRADTGAGTFAVLVASFQAPSQQSGRRESLTVTNTINVACNLTSETGTEQTTTSYARTSIAELRDRYGMLVDCSIREGLFLFHNYSGVRTFPAQSSTSSSASKNVIGDDIGNCLNMGSYSPTDPNTFAFEGDVSVPALPTQTVTKVEREWLDLARVDYDSGSSTVNDITPTGVPTHTSTQSETVAPPSYQAATSEGWYVNFGYAPSVMAAHKGKVLAIISSPRFSGKSYSSAMSNLSIAACPTFNVSGDFAGMVTFDVPSEIQFQTVASGKMSPYILGVVFFFEDIGHGYSHNGNKQYRVGELFALNHRDI